MNPNLGGQFRDPLLGAAKGGGVTGKVLMETWDEDDRGDGMKRPQRAKKKMVRTNTGKAEVEK